MSFMDKVVRGLEAIGEAIEIAAEAKKDESARRVALRTNTATGSTYRKLLDQVAGLTTREREALIEELTRFSGVEAKTEVEVVKTVVIDSNRINRNTEWTTSEIGWFDKYYNYAKQFNKTNMAEYIQKGTGTLLRNKSLIDIQERVLQYKSMGL